MTTCPNMLSLSEIIMNVKERDSILNGLILTEKIDRLLLRKIINSTLLLNEVKNPYMKISYENERKMLEKYLKSVNNDGIKRVKYVRSERMNYGRVNPKKSLGLHCIRKEIRHALMRKNYVDIDIVNAHPVILLQVCDKLKIPHKNLKRYVNERELIINEIKDEYKVSREEAKELILSLINLGSYNKWLLDRDFEIKLEFMINLTSELKEICEKLIEYNKDFYEEIKRHKKDGNIKGCFMSYYLQNIENKILEHVYLYCKREKIINNELILSNDGLMIPIENYKDEYLIKFSDVIKKELDLEIKYIRKPYDKGYSEEEIEKNQMTNIKNEFFENLELSSHMFFSELYHEIQDEKYIYNSEIGWCEYDEFNKLIIHKEIPISMNNNLLPTKDIFIIYIYEIVLN